VGLGWQSVLGVVALRAIATAWVAASGFVAISDDDYARTVIAQQFYFEPKWDPSGSSWLPFPFWLTGLLMLLAGPHILVAQIAACALSLASAAAVYVAGRWLELEERIALLGAAGAALLPHAVWLGYATVPDGYTAALALLGITSTVSKCTRRRALGAALISLAALCRYEVWSLSVFVGGLAALDALRWRRPALLAVAALAVAGPVGWMIHGQVTYGDPVFFISRVASYRQMLGRSAASFAHALLGYPRALVCAEPELAIAVVSALPLLFQRKLPATLLRPALGALVLLGFLIWGDMRDGAPTHHSERPLLCIWLLATLIAAVAVTHWLRRQRLWLMAMLPVVLVASVLRPWYTRRDSFADRSEELRLGEQARHLGEVQRLLIDSGDYGYFAVIAAFEDPRHATGIVDGDPRQAKLHFDTPAQRMRHHIRNHRADWLVVDISALEHLGAIGQTRSRVGRLALVHVDPAYVDSSYVTSQ
jgi:hypothetical protein